MDKVYKMVRVVGCSTESFEKAVENAVAKASESLKNLSWFKVVEFSGGLNQGKVMEWQATVELAFKVE